MKKKVVKLLVREWLCDPCLDGCTIASAIRRLQDLGEVHSKIHSDLTIHFDEENGYCREALYGRRPETDKETQDRISREKRIEEMNKAHELKQLEVLKAKYDRT